eukprot:TRINITY_DN2641_c0_g1_i6.p1 TRINITY_DN2641_c0_g1~~TRINITY_DN2641_c0_g1_i6.p1  ORF type:complete len:234 (-),score=56.64 TRINITY_DN2641_c0_g1_i6:20-625(-)
MAPSAKLRQRGSGPLMLLVAFVAITQKDLGLRRDFAGIQSLLKNPASSCTLTRRRCAEMEMKEDMWKSVFEEPQQWEDFREAKASGEKPERFPDFKYLLSDAALWIDSSSTPSWVHDKLEALTQTLQPEVHQVADKEEMWKSVFEEPQQWEDFREAKASGEKPERFPDFKYLLSDAALWIDSSSTPNWVHDKLEADSDLAA